MLRWWLANTNKSWRASKCCSRTLISYSTNLSCRLQRRTICWQSWSKVWRNVIYFSANKFDTTKRIFFVVRDQAKSAIEKSMDALTRSTSVSRRIVNTSSLIETDLRLQLSAVQNGNNVNVGNVPKLGNNCCNMRSVASGNNNSFLLGL